MRQTLEFNGIPVGVLLPRDDRLVFLAVKFDVIELDGRSFTSVAEAWEAVRTHVSPENSLRPDGVAIADDRVLVKAKVASGDLLEASRRV